MSAQPGAPGAVDLSGLNECQLKIATTLSEPLFVEAGAGSGKTSTLTRRIAWALSPGSGPGGAPFLDGLDQVLVITFTEAAAREIKERVRATLRLAGMTSEALAVDDAWICTIHRMCRRILTRHALDLGLDPDFDVVADSREAALFDRAMDDVMRVARADDAFAGVIGEYELGGRSPQGDYTKTMGIVSDLVRAGRSLAGGVDALVAAHGTSGVAEVMGELTARFEELAAMRLTPAMSAKVLPSLEVLRSFALLAPGRRTPEAAAEALDSVTLPSRGSAATSEALAAAKSALALARAEAAFCRAEPLSEALLELARRVERRYAEVKREEHCLDNNDLVSLALLAVRDNEEVRRDYAGRFRLVMVDEFQDTDEMQLELISLLAGTDAGRLCTVGDAQQSIYRFRGADVEVFRGRGELVGAEHTVRLDVNYRSHADVLALVERVCTGSPEPIMPEFMHLEAFPGRADAYRARALPRVDVEVCGGQGVSGRPSREQSATLAAQVADALASYRDAGERPGDMALLLGVTTHADLYIDAIRARGMECVVTGGSTFTSTKEVKVVQALLHTLANPTDTRSGLFPVLASEMFGLDANDFCELGTRAQEKIDAPTKRTIDRGLASMELFGGHVPSARLSRAHEVLGRALDDVRWRPVADVVADVVRDSGWLSRLEAGGTEGLARAANVLAAVRYVRDLTSEMGLGACRAATEFDAWLQAAKVPPSSLAGGAEQGGTVRVMTIHSSKGLEFGVCAVAECWRPRRAAARVALGPVSHGTREFVLRPNENKLETSLSNIGAEELEPSADKGASQPLAARYLAFREKQESGDAAERARLLYVALTRAREAIVLGVDAASSKAGVSSKLAARTLEALGIDPMVAGLGSAEYGGSAPARVRCVIVSREGSGADKVVTVDSAGTLPELDGQVGATDAGDLPEPAPFDLYETDAACPHVRPRGWRAREGVFSYSSVRAELTAEADTLPAPSRERWAAEAEGASDVRDDDRATNLGSAFHELAQAMVELGRVPDDGRVGAQVRRWGLSARAEGRLRAALSRWEHSSLRAEALSWPCVRSEVPFFQRVDSPYGEYLEGAIDLLCTDVDARRALVVDYKTGDVGLTSEEVRERHAMQAEFYAGVLLAEGFERVECAFVCVERERDDAPGEPLVVRYAFG